MRIRTLCILTGALILRNAALAQDIPPERLLLSRVLRHVEQEVNRQRDVSCLETVSREHKFKNGTMRPLDTVQLEVLSNGNKELYASPGARNFSESPPLDWVGSGALGNGYFGLYLAKLLSGVTSFVWKGFEETAGRRLAHWDYRMPVEFSGQSFALVDGSGNVSLHGSFWADPDTVDVVRLEVAAGDIPATLPLAEATWSIDYAPVTLAGNLTLLLPQTGDFEMTKTSGEADRNRFAFTQCHTFAAQTALNFDATDSPDSPARFAASSVDDTLRTLPTGLEIRVKLTSTLSDTMAVGALIDGVVSANAALRGAQAGAPFVIPAGSPVRGRIRRLERYTDPQPYFTVAIEYTEVSIGGIRYRFDADLTRIDSSPGIETAPPVSTRPIENMTLGRSRATGASVVVRETVRWADLPGVATFFVTESRLNLPGGVQTVWNTQRKTKRPASR